MKNRLLRLSLIFPLSFTVFISAVYAADRLTVYPAPKGAAVMNDFTVKIRQSGGQWQETPTYLVKVDKVRAATHYAEKASMAYFDFSGEVEVSVTLNAKKIDSARVRPLSYGIEPKVAGKTLTFKLDKPRNLSVEVNGDIFHNLHLFANPIDSFIPDEKDQNLIYFGAGIHALENGKMYVPSGKTVYVAGGAVLMGQILVENARDVKIMGRGIVDHTVKMGVHVANSKNVTVEGIFCTQCAVGGSDSALIRNVKVISYYGWGDGMNVFASSNVRYDGVFCRNSDDCHTVYATRKNFTGSSKNITMKNATLWADVAHPIQIGTHGNTKNPDVIENLCYTNIDILDHKEQQIDYQGCMSINAGDGNFIRNVTFDNIRVENFRQGQLVNLRVFYNSKYCTSPGRGVENVLFRNVTYNGTRSEMSVIAGYDENRKVKNITFENLIINGVRISDDMPDKPAWYKTGDMARIFIGEHVENVVFK